MPRYSAAAAAPDADVIEGNRVIFDRMRSEEAGDDAAPVLVETVTMDLAANKVDLTAHLRTHLMN